MAKVLSIAFMFLLVVAMPATGQQYDPPAEGARIIDIEFEPIEAVESLNDLLELQVGGQFSANALRNSIKNIIRLGVYSDVRVTWYPLEDGVVLRFMLEELPVIEGVTIMGNGPVSRQEVISATQLDTDNRYDESREQKIIRDLTRVYRDEGYYAAFFQVYTMINLETGGLRLEISIDPGEPTTLESVSFREGSQPKFSLEEILSSLKDTRIDGIFREAVFRDELSRIKDFYNQNNYLAAVVRLESIDYSEMDNSIHIEMQVQAGPIIQTEFDPVVPNEKELLAQIPFADEQVPVFDILNDGERRIASSLRSNGFIDAKVTFENEIIFETILIRISVDKGTIYRIGRIQIEGIEEELIQRLLPRLNLTKKGWFSSPRFSETLLDNDLAIAQQFLREEGYLEATLTTRKPEGNEDTYKVDLVIECNVGPQSVIADLSITGNESYSEDDLKSLLGISEGDALRPSAIRAAVQTLRDWYDERGWSNAVVRSRIDGPDISKSLTFEIDENGRGIVRKIIIAGNELTSDSIIRSTLTFEEGDPYSLSRITESQRALYRLGIFDRIDIDTVDDEITRQEKRVIIRVRETQPFSLLYGFGIDSEEKFRFSFGLSNNNIAGRNIQAGFSTRISQLEQRYQLSFRTPRLIRILGDNLLRLFYEDLTRPAFRSQKRGIIYETSGLNWGEWQLIGQFQYKWIDTFRLVEDIEPNRFEQPVQLGLLSSIFSRDSRDDLIDPSAGSLTNFIVQLSPNLFGGDSGYIRSEGQYYFYRDIVPKVILASGIRLGVAVPFRDRKQIPSIDSSLPGTEKLIPISERFFLGGSNSLRGFPLDGVPAFPASGDTDFPLGGNAAFSGNVELRFPLLGGLGGVTFYDFGKVYLLIEDFDLSELEHALGLGLRIATPLGPLRVDWGTSLRTRKQSQWYFTFGHAF